LSGKPGNVSKFETCRDYVNSQGIVLVKSGKS